MKTLCGSHLRSWLRGRFIARGEDSIASTGAAAVAVLLMILLANGWWMLTTASEAELDARTSQVRTIGSILSRSAEVMLAGGDLTALRRLVADTSRNFHLAQCRITIGPGLVLADGTPSRINQRLLPEKWDAGPLDAAPLGSFDNAISARYPILVANRGTAELDIVAPKSGPWWTLWRTQSGIALISAAGLGALLLVYRRNRRKLIALESILDGLRAFAGGETAIAAIAVDARLGPLAGAWNKLLEELEGLRRKASLIRVNSGGLDRRSGVASLESACDTMSQGLILVDDRMRVRFANGAASVFINTTREALIGKAVTELIPDDKIREAVRGIAVEKLRRTVTVEVCGQGDGSGVLKFSIRPTRMGDPDAATIVIEDITPQRTAERARNSFITQVTHELRAPLTNIRLYVETAIDEGNSNSESRSKCLNVINQESRRLERIVGDMLSVAEIETGSCSIHKDDVHLDVLFKELQDDYQALADEKNIKFEFVLPPKLPILHADRDKLALAIHNLVGNALKYTPEEGKVTVSADLRNGKVYIDVADAGIGIRPDEIEKIFERFTRSQDPRVGKIVGTGLGLTLAREVMRLHGGDVTVESELNRGSTFTATIPVTAEAA